MPDKEIKVGDEVLIDDAGGNPVWAVVEHICPNTGEVHCTGDDGQDFYVGSIEELTLYQLN